MITSVLRFGCNSRSDKYICTTSNSLRRHELKLNVSSLSLSVVMSSHKRYVDDDGDEESGPPHKKQRLTKKEKQMESEEKQRKKEEEEYHEKEEAKQRRRDELLSTIRNQNSIEMKSKQIANFTKYIMDSSHNHSIHNATDRNNALAMAAFNMKSAFIRINNLLTNNAAASLETPIIYKKLSSIDNEMSFDTAFNVFDNYFGGFDSVRKQPAKSSEMCLLGTPLSAINFCRIYSHPVAVKGEKAFIELFDLKSDKSIKAIKGRITRRRQTHCDGAFCNMISHYTKVVQEAQDNAEIILNEETFIYEITKSIIKRKYSTKNTRMRRRVILLTLHQIFAQKRNFFEE
eukprot:140924_1